MTSTAVGTEGEEDEMARSSAQREQLAEEGREAGRSLMQEEREKHRAKNGSLRNTSTDSKGAAFVILKDHTSAPIRKKRLSPTSKARREASRNQFVVKGRMPDRVKSFGEIDSRQNRSRAWPGFVKPIRNGLRKYRIWSSVDRLSP